jgi:hypothetical protein
MEWLVPCCESLRSPEGFLKEVNFELSLGGIQEEEKIFCAMTENTRQNGICF